MEEPGNLHLKGQDNSKGKGKGPGDEGKGKGPADKGKGKGLVGEGKGKGKGKGKGEGEGKVLGSKGKVLERRPASAKRPGERSLYRPAFQAMHGPDRSGSEPPARWPKWPDPRDWDLAVMDA